MAREWLRRPLVRISRCGVCTCVRAYLANASSASIRFARQCARPRPSWSYPGTSNRALVLFLLSTSPMRECSFKKRCSVRAYTQLFLSLFRLHRRPDESVFRHIDAGKGTQSRVPGGRCGVRQRENGVAQGAWTMSGLTTDELLGGGPLLTADCSLLTARCDAPLSSVRTAYAECGFFECEEGRQGGKALETCWWVGRRRK
jgi:hypothetical protein